MNNLQEQYNKIIKEYGEDRIVWIAASGHSAYKQDSMSGEPVTACYLPTEDELYNITPHNDLIDIRNIISLALDKDSSLLDTILQFESSDLEKEDAKELLNYIKYELI